MACMAIGHDGDRDYLNFVFNWVSEPLWCWLKDPWPNLLNIMAFSWLCVSVLLNSPRHQRIKRVALD